MKADRESAASLLVKLHDLFGDRIDVDILDPRCLFWLLDLIRYRVKNTEAVWVLDGKLLFRGIPEWEALRDALLERIGSP